MENNDQNLNNQVNTNNIENKQMQNNNGNNKILIILMALIIVGLAGYLVYEKFIQNSDSPAPKTGNTQEQDNGSSANSQYENTDENTELNNQVKDDSKITKLEKYELSKSNKEFTIGSKKVNIKATDNNVYVDDKKVTYYGESASVYVTNKFILIVNSAQLDTFPKAINENGQVIDIVGIEATPSRLIENLRIDGGKLIASRSDETNIEAGSTIVEFVYDMNKITIKEAK